MVLQIIWYLLVGVLIAVYGILGGYDMGVGSLYLINKSDENRRTMLSAIGPYWDANQVWLITAGGAIFAAFPFVFATVFSGFYLAMILLLFGIIIRTVSIEFRYQLSSPGWEKIWDLSFGVGSILPSILFGVAMGNIIRGIPLDAQSNFAGTFFSLLNPYAILFGLLSFVMFAIQGSSFLILQTSDPVSSLARSWARKLWPFYIALFLIISVASLILAPHLFANMKAFPVLFVFPAVVLAAMLFYPIMLKKDSKWGPIVINSLAILALVGTVGASLFPRLVPNLRSIDQFTSFFVAGLSSNHLQNSLTAFNSSSSPLTLTVMLIIAGIGVPLVLAYTAYVYYKMNKQ